MYLDIPYILGLIGMQSQCLSIEPAREWQTLSFPVSLMARVAAWPRLSQADPDSESRVSHKGAEGGNVP